MKRSPIPQGVRFNVLRRDNFTCRYCGGKSPDVTLHLDHVKPHSKGGEDTEENLITSCLSCNYGKGAKTDVEPPVVTPPSGDHGFVGFFGHTFHDDGDFKYQFRVLRQVGPDKYAVQLFSWAFGDPTDIHVWSADDLSEKTVRLYATADAWRRAHEDSLEQR